MENNELKERIRKNVKEKIAVSNIRKEFDMNKTNNKKIIYTISSICAVFVLCIGIAVNMKLQGNNNNDIQIATRNDNNKYVKDLESNINEEKEDSIIFNSGTIKSSADIDGRFEEIDLNQEFDFIDKIAVPDNLKLVRQGKLFVKPNTESVEYSKLRQYVLMYYEETDKDPSYIEITFTTEDRILGCMLPNEEYMKNSIINGKEVKLFKGEYLGDRNKIVGNAFFEISGYKFFVEAHKTDENEFLYTVKSILNLPIINTKSDKDVGVQEQPNEILNKNYPEYYGGKEELQNKISQKMIDKEFAFVTKSAVMEDDNNIKVTVISSNESDLNKIKALDAIGGAIDIEYNTNSRITKDLLIEKK